MRTTLDERPWWQLASHFFRKLFDFGLLSEAGADAYRRILIALIAVILSVGLLATRMYLQVRGAFAAGTMTGAVAINRTVDRTSGGPR